MEKKFQLYTTMTLVYLMYKRHICLIEVIVFLILVVVRTYTDPIPHMCEVCPGGEPSYVARLTSLYISYYFINFQIYLIVILYRQGDRKA